MTPRSKASARRSRRCSPTSRAPPNWSRTSIPSRRARLSNPALKLMIEAVRRYDGYVVQSTGDGIFAPFGAPIGSEEMRLLAALRRMLFA